MKRRSTRSGGPRAVAATAAIDENPETATAARKTAGARRIAAARKTAVAEKTTTAKAAGITAGAGKPAIGVDSVVVLYLREPSAKVWGVIRSLDGTGVAVEGFDLRSFDEVLRGVASGEIGPGDLSLAFYPLGRVEKILLDRGTEAAPALIDQFCARVGVGLLEYLKAAAR